MILTCPPVSELYRQCEELVHGRSPGFCSGTFDLLNVGHVNFLRHCFERCGALVVEVGRDEQVRRLKPGRPIVPEEQRLELVNAIRTVDYCFLDPWCRHDMSGLEEAMKVVKPVKYFCAVGDRDMDQRADICKRLGVQLVQVPRLEGVSTTQTLERINRDAVPQAP